VEVEKSSRWLYSHPQKWLYFSAMTKPYSPTLRDEMISRLTAVNAVSAAQLARETGIPQQNLSRWLTDARSAPVKVADTGLLRTWTVEQKARIISQAAELAYVELAGFLQRNGVGFAQFHRWRLKLEESGKENAGMTRRMRRLERELTRKEKALARAAALLLLRQPVELRHKNDRREEDLSFSI
jgi:transposase